MLGIFGDSLTAGTLGVSYVKGSKTCRSREAADLLCEGRKRGHTMTGVLRRAPRIPCSADMPGSIQGLSLKQAAATICLLPYMASISPAWKQAGQ